MLSAEHRGLLLLLLATALLYLPALSAEFVGFDDYEYVKVNPDVRQPEVLRVFDLKHTTIADWTPVGTLSYALDYRLFGLDARAFHATNLLLHLACLVLMYFLLCDLEVSASLALLATLVFAIHPLQVESVAWVSSRKNLLAALFGLAFCREFLAARPLSATLFLLLALGSKGTAVVFPLWAAVLWACRFGAMRRRQGAVWLVLFAALAAARALLSVTSQAVVIGPRDASAMTLSQRLTIIGRVLSTQLRQFFLPSDLSLYYSWTLGHWSEPRVLVSWAVVLGVAVAIIWLARRDVRIGVMGSFVILGLLPTLNIVPAPYFQADRYTHLALVGGSVLGVLLLRPLRGVHQRLPAVVLALWCALVAVPTTRARIAVWRNTEALWNDTLRSAPNISFFWNGLGMYYLEKGDTQKAEPALRRALELEPDLETARFNLALILANHGLPADGIRELNLLISSHPTSVRGQQLLGQLLGEQGDNEQAMLHLDTALRLDPTDKLARYHRARTLARLHRFDAAAQDFEELLHQSRAAVLLSGLASVRLQQGRPADAVALARQATQGDPHQVEAWDTLGQGLAATGDVAGAESALRSGIDANAQAGELWYRLAQVRAARGDRDGAHEAAAQALQHLDNGAHPLWENDARALL